MLCIFFNYSTKKFLNSSGSSAEKWEGFTYRLNLLFCIFNILFLQIKNYFCDLNQLDSIKLLIIINAPC